MPAHYVLSKSYGHVFRYQFPKDIKPLVGKSEIRLSLQTRELGLAKSRSRMIAGHLQMLIRTLRKGGGMAKLKAEQINGIINQYLKEALEEDENKRILDDNPFDKSFHEDHTQILGMIKDVFQVKLAKKDIPFIEEEIEKLLTNKGLEADKDSFEYKKLCREFFKVSSTLYGIKQKRQQGDYSDDTTSLVQPPTPAPVISPTPAPLTPPYPIAPVAINVAQKDPQGPTIKSLVDEWVSESTKADLWKPRSLKQYTGYFSIMLPIMGEDTPIDSIDHGTVRDLKKTLQEIPSGMNKKKIFNGKSIDEVISINKEQGFNTLSVTTINGYITTLGAFFKWCVGQGYMTTNFADGMKIKQRKQKRPDQQRQAFTTVHLNQMFQSPEYLEDAHKQSFQFWLPILGLYTGARLNELCQLRLKDIQTIDDIMCLVLQEDSEDPTISLKNAASNRTIPLHPFVTDELNFRGYVDHLMETGETRLFPELPYQNDSYGHQGNKWFSAFKKRCGLDSSLLVFHSFRHTLTDNLKQQLIHETLIDELTGHALQGETMGRYGKRYGVGVLYDEAVVKLDYSGVDLGHLKGSKWVVK